MIAPRALVPLSSVVLAAAGSAASGQTVITVTTTIPAVAADGQCSLIEAIENANAAAVVHPDCTPGSTTSKGTRR